MGTALTWWWGAQKCKAAIVGVRENMGSESFYHAVECRHGLAMRILFVRLSNACIMTKWKKDLSRFLYHTKEHLA